MAKNYQRTLLFIVNVDWFFFSHRLPIAIKAQSEGYKIHVLCKFTDKIIPLRSYGFELHNINFVRSKLSLFSDFIALIKIAHIFFYVKPDIVHLITIKPILLGGLLARFFSVKSLVVSIPGLGLSLDAKSVTQKVRRMIIFFFYKFIFSHKNMKIIFQNVNDIKLLREKIKLSNSKIILIHGSGVDLEVFSYTPLNKKIRTVAFIGRLLKNKGIYDFIEACNYINSSIKNLPYKVNFVFFGKIDPENPTSLSFKDIKEIQNKGVVDYLGESDDIAGMMKNIYMVVMPSYYGEGLPKVLIEAAASGRPVITTNLPGCRDAVLNNISGLLVEPCKPLQLAKAIYDLLINFKKASMMGYRGRRLAENKFNVHEVTSSHINIYKNLIKSAR